MDAIDIKFYENEIRALRYSKKYKDMATGERYFKGDHDILKRKREVIGPDGKLVEVKNLPNYHIVDNQYAKMVSQKSNYILGKPITIRTENAQYAVALSKIFNAKFMRSMKRIAQGSLNHGLSWLFVYYDDKGMLGFKQLKGSEVIPGWADEEHTTLDYAIRTYKVNGYDNDTNKQITTEKVEIYRPEGVYYFERKNGRLIPEPERQKAYIYDGEEAFNWNRVPLIPFRYNEDEIPLINKVKSLQDAINLIKSNFQNVMTEDPRNTLMVLINYDGDDPGEFRQNIATFGVVKVSTIDGVAGDVKTLRIEVNAENYKVILDLLKKALIENAMGYDAKDDRLSGNANQMNIQSMYSDIDLDTDGMETEYQAAFEELLWFVNCYFEHIGLGNFENEKVEIIFNRDIMINESDVIDNIQKSEGILSRETLIAQHPWVDDVQAELDKLKNQEEEYNPFAQAQESRDGDE